MNPKFKVGDLVLINPEKLSDLDADMRQDLSDRSLSGAAYDAFYAAIVDGKPFTVAVVLNKPYNAYGDCYELKLGNRKFGYQLSEIDLVKIDRIKSP